MVVEHAAMIAWLQNCGSEHAFVLGPLVQLPPERVGYGRLTSSPRDRNATRRLRGVRSVCRRLVLACRTSRADINVNLVFESSTRGVNRRREAHRSGIT
jgi:hypothetical protein